MNEENLKKLKTALISHKSLIVDFENGLLEELYFDEKINCYRGKEIGIWSMRLLLEIAKEKFQGVKIIEGR